MMKARNAWPVAIYLVCLAGSLVALFWLIQGLPKRMATHFNAAGRADGWMSRAAFLQFFGLFVILFPLLTPTLTGLLRFVPPAAFNLPNKELWMRPENRVEIGWFLFYSSFWHAASSVVFAGGLFYLTALANRAGTPKLDGPGLGVLTGFYLLATLGWVIWILWFLLHPPKGKTAPVS